MGICQSKFICNKILRNLGWCRQRLSCQSKRRIKMSYLESKSGSMSEVVKEMQKHIKDNAYQDMFKKELEKAGKGIGAMTPAEKKAFFNKIDTKYKAKNEEVSESASQVQVKRDGKGNFNLMFKGKEIGYYHKSGSKYMVYYDNEDGDYNQSDEVSSEMQAKKLAYDNMNETVDEIGKKVEPKYNKKEGLETVVPPKNKEEDEKDLNRKTTMTGSKPTEIDTKPQIKY